MHILLFRLTGREREALRPYEWMIEPTPQTEWIEGRGILVWLAFFFVELGAGTYIMSSIFGSRMGMLVGWVICAFLGGGFHLLYLGHPLRCWRILISSGWRTSWISRGLYCVMIFLLLGAVSLIPAERGSPIPGWVLGADVFAFLTVIYGGFAMNYVNGIQLWNNGLLPVLCGAGGMWGGTGVTMLISLLSGSTIAIAVAEWGRVFLVSFIFLAPTYLLSAVYRGTAGRFSVKQMLTGRWALPFWMVAVALGMIFPLTVALGSWATGLSKIPFVLVCLSIVFELLGDLSLRYCIFRCGFYSSLLYPGCSSTEGGSGNQR